MNQGLSILRHNVCFLSKNFDQLHALLTDLDIDFYFIGITQSHISKTNSSPTNIALANYAIEQTPTEYKAGGADLHINRKHSYKIWKHLKIYEPDKTESVFVEVMSKRTNIIIGAFIYTLIMILMILTQITYNFSSKNYLKNRQKNTFLLSDFNIGLLKFNCFQFNLQFFGWTLIKLFHAPNFSSLMYN